jgi:hypothetical protein
MKSGMHSAVLLESGSSRQVRAVTSSDVQISIHHLASPYRIADQFLNGTIPKPTQ